MSKEFEKDFEISMLFHAKEIVSTPSLAGILKKNPATGEYENNEVNVAFKAYCMAMNHRLDAVERCKPDRYISTGMITQFHESKCSTVQDIFGVVLKISNDSPVT